MRAVPKQFYLKWVNSVGKEESLEFRFMEEEIFKKYENANQGNPSAVRLKMAVNELPLKTEMQVFVEPAPSAEQR